MTNETEIWKAVPGYEGLYEVSDRGRVRSLERLVRNSPRTMRRVKPRVLKSWKDRAGYCIISLHRHGKKKNRGVHVHVALAFIGEPSGKIGCRAGQWQVNHKNGVHDDNRPENLEWMTPQGNSRHAVGHGLSRQRGETSRQAKLTEADVLEIRRQRHRGEPLNAMTDRFNVSRQTISKIARGARWKHVGGPRTKGQPVGSAVASSKLTEPHVSEIKRLLCQEHSIKGLARRFGVDGRTIRSIRDGETWKHVS